MFLDKMCTRYSILLVLTIVHVQFTCTFSSEETAHWCGGCLVPLAMLFPDEEVHRHTARGDMAAVCILSTQVEKTITLPVEPKVNRNQSCTLSI